MKMSKREMNGIVERFDEAVRGMMKSRGCSRLAAVRLVAKRDPTLHETYLRVMNPTTSARSDPGPTPDGIATIRQFHRMICEEMEASGSTRLAATIKVARANPGLHKAFLQATNPGAVL